MKKIADLWSKLEKVELVQVRPVEMESLYKHCFEFEQPFIVEIGSAHGASSIILAEAARELRGHLICIDSFPEDYYGQPKFGNYARNAFKENLKDYSDVMELLDTTSDVAINKIKNLITETGLISVLFIDGSHDYQDVKSDCQNYLPLLRSGGYVGFHDYNNVAFPGVKTAADEFTKDWETESFWDLIVRRKP